MRSRVRGTVTVIILILLAGCKVAPDPIASDAAGVEPAALAVAPEAPNSAPAEPAAEPAEMPLPTLPPAPPNAFLRLGDALPAPTDLAASRRAATTAHLAALRRWIAGQGYRGVLLGQRANYAWLTGGADPQAAALAPPAVAAVLVDRTLIVATSDALPAARAALAGQGFQGLQFRWDLRSPDAVVAAVRSVGGQGRYAADKHLPGTEYVADALLALRLDLAGEQATLLRLGVDLGRVVASQAGRAQAEMTESALAERLRDGLREVGIEPVSVMVTALPRYTADGLLPAGATTLAPGAAIQVVGERDGVRVLLGRTVAPAPTGDAVDQMVRARRIYAGLIPAVRGGATLREVHAAAVAAAKEAGEPELYRWQSPGGLGAFELAAQPFGPTGIERLKPGQAAVVVVPARAAYLADTLLIEARGVTAVTLTEGWPAPVVTIDGASLPVPTLRGGEQAVAEAELRRAAELSRAKLVEFLQQTVGAAAAAAVTQTRPAAPPAPEPR